jgi:hypothetical protein
MGIDDESVFSEYEKNELEHPTPRKISNGRTVYHSRPLPLTFGPPVLCDLGEARLGDKEHRDDIMPDVYRAPEVILGMEWGYKVDIWNVAMVVRVQYLYFFGGLKQIMSADTSRSGIFSSPTAYFKEEAQAESTTTNTTLQK